jgi:hypothetical protein
VETGGSNAARRYRPTLPSEIQPKWSSLSTWRRASIWSISFLEMKAASASSLDLEIWFRVLGLIVGLRSMFLAEPMNASFVRHIKQKSTREQRLSD